MMLEFQSQVCALLGGAFVLYIATMPRKYSTNDTDPNVTICKQGARRYSRAAMRQVSFSEYDF